MYLYGEFLDECNNSALLSTKDKNNKGFLSLRIYGNEQEERSEAKDFQGMSKGQIL